MEGVSMLFNKRIETVRNKLESATVVVYETENMAADYAVKAFQNYLESQNTPGLSLGQVSRVKLDSTQMYLNVDDGNSHLLSFFFFFLSVHGSPTS